jgi:hypothetical protein
MQNEPFDQLEPLSTPPKPKMPLGKVVLINFGIMIAYMLLTSLTMGGSGGGGEAGLGVVIADAFLILAQVGINMLVGMILVFSAEKKHVGSALLIGGVITAVIGFGSCLAHISIIEA